MDMISYSTNPLDLLFWAIHFSHPNVICNLFYYRNPTKSRLLCFVNYQMYVVIFDNWLPKTKSKKKNQKLITIFHKNK